MMSLVVVECSTYSKSGLHEGGHEGSDQESVELHVEVGELELTGLLES